MKYFLRWWYSLNFRFCKAEKYLATQRQEILMAVWWSRQANEWQEKWRTT